MRFCLAAKLYLPFQCVRRMRRPKAFYARSAVSLAEPRPFHSARWLREAIRSAAPRTEDSSCETSLPLMKTLKDYPTRGGSSPWSHPTSYATGTAGGELRKLAYWLFFGHSSRTLGCFENPRVKKRETRLYR